MYYKTIEKRLVSTGWEIIDESHESEPNQPGRLVPHYVEWAHPSDTSNDKIHVITIAADSNKDGTPGKIRFVWYGGKPARF